MSNVGVHKSHCCVLHGCKYREDNCPVEYKEVTQDYLCDECWDDGLRSLEDLELILSTDCCSDMIEFSRNTENFRNLKKFKVCPFCLKEIKHK